MCKFLMIDDNEVDQFIMNRMLEKYDMFHQKDFDVDGEAAFNTIQANLQDEEKLPDVIFLDLKMPNFSGHHFLEKFERLRSSLKKRIDIFVISSSLSPKDMAVTTRFPFVKDYIIKPVTRNMLSKIHDTYAKFSS